MDTRRSKLNPRYSIQSNDNGTFSVMDLEAPPQFGPRVVYDQAPTVERAEQAAYDLPR